MKKNDILQWILSIGALITGYSITFHSPCASGSPGVFTLFVVSSLLLSPIINSYIPGVKSSPTGVTIQIFVAVLFFVFALISTYPHCRGIHIPFVQENARVSYWDRNNTAGGGEYAGNDDRAGYIEEDSESGDNEGGESSQLDTVRDEEVSSEQAADGDISGQRGTADSAGDNGRASAGSSVPERTAYNSNTSSSAERSNISTDSKRLHATNAAGTYGAARDTGRRSREIKSGTGSEYALSDGTDAGRQIRRTNNGNESAQTAGRSRNTSTQRRTPPVNTVVKKWPDGSIYSGEWKNGKRNGTGTMKWSGAGAENASTTGIAGKLSQMGLWNYDRRGSVSAAVVAYSGSWKDDIPFKNGSFSWNNNDYYRGSFNNMQRHGYGIYHYVHGTEYRGNWRNNKAHGKGLIAWKNGDKYSGEWKNDRREGSGTYIWHGGIRYKGSWHNDMMHGNGIINWTNGNRYIGQWNNNQREGKGIYLWKSGDKYEGTFVNDKRNGYGVYVWADGREYKGQWKNGLMDGEGHLQYPDGKVLQGTFRNNNYAGK